MPNHLLPALSVQQPWAWLLVHGHKDVENRTWTTHYRGPLLIHAPRKLDMEGWAWVRRNFPIALPSPSSFPRGGIVGRVQLVDIVEELDSPWFFGPKGWVVSSPEPLPFRSCPGKLSLFYPKVTYA